MKQHGLKGVSRGVQEMHRKLVLKGYHKATSMPVSAFGSLEHAPRNVQIVQERVFRGRTLSDVGRQFSLSQEVVRQICARACRKVLKDEYWSR